PGARSGHTAREHLAGIVCAGGASLGAYETVSFSLGTSDEMAANVGPRGGVQAGRSSSEGARLIDPIEPRGTRTEPGGTYAGSQGQRDRTGVRVTRRVSSSCGFGDHTIKVRPSSRQPPNRRTALENRRAAA